MIRSLALVVLVVGACTANDDVPAPAVGGITPNHAAPGTAVVISGSYFCQQPESSSGETDPLACEHMGAVVFGVEPTTPQNYTDTSITVSVPQQQPGMVQVGVSVAGRSSNTVSFTID